MLGPLKVRDLQHPIVVSLESMVPADHFYRHLDRSLDLSFVRELVKDCYSPIGRPSIDPVVFFRAMTREYLLLRVTFSRLLSDPFQQ